MVTRTAERILQRANEIYALRKLGDSLPYAAPETIPTIQSTQLQAALEAVSEEIETLYRQIGQMGQIGQIDRISKSGKGGA